MRRTLKIVIINGFVLLLLFFLMEGAASTLLILREIAANPVVAERLHADYDPEIGWINKRDVHIPDLYGPGIGLSTNSQSFRNREAFPRQVPPNKVRVICSGDSFTLGFGVDDDHTWCQLLVGINQRLETVNMGQGGYGVDQAYLWYKRNSNKLEHHIHIFAFITNDFIRMQSDKFEGYGKPLLEIQNGLIVIKNKPVPKWSYHVPWLTRNLPTISELNSVRLLRGFGLLIAPSFTRSDKQPDEQTREIAARIFADLREMNLAKNSILALTYLPTVGDYMGTDASEVWRQFVRGEAAKNGVLFIDLIDEFRTLAPPEARNLFSGGHYSAQGNRYIAEVLYKKLSAVPDVRYRIDATDVSRR